MICDDCKKRDAVVHMTKMIHGYKEELHLCDVCAKARESSEVVNEFSIPSFLTSILDANFNSNLKANYNAIIQCNHCGTTYNKFKESGRLGCDECHQVFKEKLNPLLRRIHGNSKHVGKVPKRTGGAIHLKRKVSQLKQKLQEAIAEEAFEKAVNYRDEIRALEEEINKG
ncbi:UvrB/UvrC motif-containing protein [Alkaliphilus peptidifermentans]|uniref:Protein-arginine kinase activator protein McsA n=1 Tax=Alkaliphilus peptidifermentans DSM 18978 TaxID=1120976 RepID=A0A1G5KZE1_9FIRM|nr:UvrB/UvrC motif-containing protein [Alkaliphilus peptidifermentans]SCZ05704.1 Protein-arginine kinase activator protein McsA [Alkaliphilus peptidifermentans DSM 18978]